MMARSGAPLLFTALFAALLGWFALQRFYWESFTQTGAGVSFYLLMRLAFVPCFAWLMMAAGEGALRLLAGKAWYENWPFPDRLFAAFFAGCGVWQIAGFALGLLGLYRQEIAIALALIVMLASVQWMPVYGAALANSFRSRNKILWLFPLAAALLLAFTKGIYPAGGHDYFTHYFHFYNAVLRDHAIRPNEIWYEFFACKGAGLFFWAMLLTDPLAPQLVSLMLALASAALLAHWVTRLGGGAVMGALMAGIFMLLLVYTPGPAVFREQGGWGDFEKLHEPAAALTFGALWLLTRGARWPLALTGAGLMLFHQPAGIALALLAGLVWLYRRAWPPFLLGLACGLALLAVVAVNYFFTGIPLDLSLKSWRPWFDLAAIARWGVGLELFFIQWWDHLRQSQFPMTPDLLPLAAFYFLRLDVLWPLALAALLGWRRLGVVKIPLAYLAVMLLLMSTAGYYQIVSFYRMGSVIVAPLLLILALAVPRTALAVVLAVPFLPLWQADRTLFADAARFAGGGYSIEDAYRHQEGWPGRQPWGAVYPAAAKACELAPHARIWSPSRVAYAMTPACRIETLVSFRFSPRWREVLLGAPEQARAILQEEKLDYFLFATGQEMFDLLPRAPLFAPENIARHLAVRWHEGGDYLLTWKGRPHTSPIGEDFLAAYRAQLARPSLLHEFPLRQAAESQP